VFIAIDQFGNKVSPIENSEEELRLLSRSKMLFCPECQSVLRFASGVQVSAHFKHDHNSDCSYDSEPETEEHIQGKIQIRNWLVQNYPDAHVEFEYKIVETNQRADVIAIFPNGEKIAFEMQCSKIQGSVWKERHQLYEKSGIKDYWILGQSVHKYGKSNGEVDTDKHQLISLASEIYNLQNSLVFLDTKTSIIKGLYSHNKETWHSDTILLIKEVEYPINEAIIFKEFIATQNIKKDYDRWLKQKIENEKWMEKRKEDERLKKEEYEQAIKLKEKKELERLEQHLEALNLTTIDSIKQQMTKNEKNLFEQLLWKHEYNDETFPGIFKVHTLHNYLIKTPFQLWQFWIYDRYIHNKKESRKKVWIPTIQEEFYKMYSKGIFRLNTESQLPHFSFAIYNYIEQLNTIGIMISLSSRSTKYQEILCDTLPPLTGKEVHDSVGYYFSAPHFVNNRMNTNNLFQEIHNCGVLYQKMIKEYRGSPKEIIPSKRKASEEESVLEFINNLIIARVELATDWERTFIADMLKQNQNGTTPSEKQNKKITDIRERIEKALGISLTYNR
jgi:competence protein CoiA